MVNYGFEFEGEESSLEIISEEQVIKLSLYCIFLKPNFGKS